ncbi:MAG: hypothetical protein IK128_06690 [Clostridiales bacterium]|nr:hypothetical protein [Clostridiales bacterium]
MSLKMRICLTGLIAAMAMTAFAGCASETDTKAKDADAGTEVSASEESETEPEETKATISAPSKPTDSDAVLFIVGNTNDGPFDWGNDYIEHTTFTVYYNGNLEIVQEFSESGEQTTNKQLTNADFSQISSNMSDAYIKQPWTYKDYSDYMDGYTWSFQYFDESGEKTYIYGGYTDGCSSLETIQNILKSYLD